MRLGRYLVAAGVALLIYANVRLARSRIARRGSSKPSERWRELRPTACDGVRIPRAASIGVRADGTIVPLLRTLGKREELASLANDLNLTRTAAELGVFRGEFSELNMARWRGAKMTLVDTWEASDCVAGNASACVYTNDSRSYDKMVTRLRMERGGPSFAGRWEMVQATTTEAARRYPDGHFDWIYLDATHTYAEARDDLQDEMDEVAQVSDAIGEIGAAAAAAGGGVEDDDPELLAEPEALSAEAELEAQLAGLVINGGSSKGKVGAGQVQVTMPRAAPNSGSTARSPVTARAPVVAASSGGERKAASLA